MILYSFYFLAIIGNVKKYHLELTPWNFYLGSKKARKAAAAQKEEGVGGPMDEVSHECNAMNALSILISSHVISLLSFLITFNT